jgi:hypothetical protein
MRTAAAIKKNESAKEVRSMGSSQAAIRTKQEQKVKATALVVDGRLLDGYASEETECPLSANCDI